MEFTKHGSGTPVLFLHPALLDGRYWRAVVERRPSGFEAWVVDLPDHATDEPNIDPAALEARLLHLLERVPQPFILVGASYGGYLAARLAPRLTGLRRLVIQSGLAVIPQAMADGFAELADEIESATVNARETLRSAFETAAGARIPPALLGELHEIGDGWSNERIVRSLRRTAALRSRPAREVIQVPLTVLHAADDASVPIELGRQVAALGERAEFLELPDGGHCLAMTEADQLARIAFES